MATSLNGDVTNRNTVNMSHPYITNMARRWRRSGSDADTLSIDGDAPTTTPIPTLLPTTSPLSKRLQMSYTVEYTNYTQILHRSRNSSNNCVKTKLLLIVNNIYVYVSSKDRCRPNPRLPTLCKSYVNHLQHFHRNVLLPIKASEKLVNESEIRNEISRN